MNTKSFLLFIGGIVIGSSAGVLGTKKYFKTKYEKMYEEDYKSLAGYYLRNNDEDDDHNEINPDESDALPGGRMNEKERKDIKDKLKNNIEEPINYAGIYKEKNMKLEDYPICANCKVYDPESNICELHGFEVIADATACEDIEKEISEEEEIFDEYQKNKTKSPKIISAEAFSDLPAHIDKKVLYLYTYDEVVVDEDNEDEPIEEIERLIGDALTKYNFIDNDVEHIIFVRNYDLDICYEIQKIDASWGDSH